MKKIILFLVLMGVSAASFSAVDCTVNTNQACRGPVKEIITGVFPTSSGDLLLTSPLVVSSLACTGSSGGNNLKLPANHLGFEETYALILFALANNSKVTIRIESAAISAGSECLVSYARLEVE